MSVRHDATETVAVIIIIVIVMMKFTILIIMMKFTGSAVLCLFQNRRPGAGGGSGDGDDVRHDAGPGRGLHHLSAAHQPDIVTPHPLPPPLWARSRQREGMLMMFGMMLGLAGGSIISLLLIYLIR